MKTQLPRDFFPTPPNRPAPPGMGRRRQGCFGWLHWGGVDPLLGIFGRILARGVFGHGRILESSTASVQT